MVDETAFRFAHAQLLGPRLSPEERRAILPPALVRDADLFGTTLTLMGSTLGASAAVRLGEVARLCRP